MDATAIEIVRIPTPSPADASAIDAQPPCWAFFWQGVIKLSATQDVTIEGMKAAPPVIVSGAMLFGMTPTEWVTALTVLYLLLQIGLLIPRYWSQFRAWARPGRRAAK